MAKFQFRLATLRKIREMNRDQRRARLADAQQADEILCGQLDQVDRAIGAIKEECRRASAPGAVDVDRLTQAHLHELLLKTQHKHFGQQRDAIAKEIVVRRESLVQADREVRVLEKLEEKQADRHRQEEERRQLKQLDEVAGQRAAREDFP